MSQDFPLKGLAELDKYLSHFPRNLQTGAYRAGLTAAARVIRDEARLRAPKRTGQMAKSIKSGSARRNSDGSFSISVRLQGPHAFIGVFHEYGVQPHYITAGESNLSARKLTQKARREGAMKIGENYITGAILHPGHAPRPFMRPALDSAAQEAVMAFRDRIVAYMEKKTGFLAPLDEAA